MGTNENGDADSGRIGEIPARGKTNQGRQWRQRRRDASVSRQGRWQRSRRAGFEGGLADRGATWLATGWLGDAGAVYASAHNHDETW